MGLPLKMTLLDTSPLKGGKTKFHKCKNITQVLFNVVLLTN